MSWFPDDEQARACFSPQIDEPKAKLQSLSVSGECIYIHMMRSLSSQLFLCL